MIIPCWLFKRVCRGKREGRTPIDLLVSTHCFQHLLHQCSLFFHLCKFFRFQDKILQKKNNQQTWCRPNKSRQHSNKKIYFQKRGEGTECAYQYNGPCCTKHYIGKPGERSGLQSHGLCNFGGMFLIMRQCSRKVHIGKDHEYKGLKDCGEAQQQVCRKRH